LTSIGAARGAAPIGDPVASGAEAAGGHRHAAVAYERTSRGGIAIHIGPLVTTEVGDLFALFADVVASGDGYPHAPPLTRQVFDSTWVEPVTIVVAARIEGALAGAYYLKPNFAGKAAHIANAGYVVDVAHRGKGIGRVLVEDSIWRAAAVGFDAVQFNLVFESNRARSLYEELGWEVMGRVPAAVNGEDALIYYRRV
jgi:GNAT superfamily N-acetyltransferase